VAPGVPRDLTSPLGEGPCAVPGAPWGGPPRGIPGGNERGGPTGSSSTGAVYPGVGGARGCTQGCRARGCTLGRGHRRGCPCGSGGEPESSRAAAAAPAHADDAAANPAPAAAAVPAPAAAPPPPPPPAAAAAPAAPAAAAPGTGLRIRGFSGIRVGVQNGTLRSQCHQPQGHAPRQRPLPDSTGPRLHWPLPCVPSCSLGQQGQHLGCFYGQWCQWCTLCWVHLTLYSPRTRYSAHRAAGPGRTGGLPQGWLTAQGACKRLRSRGERYTPGE